MSGFAALASSGRPGMRWRLRAATATTHERMHAHAGFEAAAAGTIEVSDYRRLLVRLYGFHRPFEDIVRSAAEVFRIDLDMNARARSPLLLADLQTIGFDSSAAVTFPLWRPSVRLVSKGSLLGALYVLEGSTLGGVQIARALKDRVGNGLENALLFFVGREERQGAIWRELVEELESFREDDEESMHAEDAAVTTFKAFEDWMAGWRIEVDAST
jgi:heme oxygenase (biliverdin-IX-beta and delta-forming)